VFYRVEPGRIVILAIFHGRKPTHLADARITPVRADARKRERFACDGVSMRAVSRAPRNMLLGLKEMQCSSTPHFGHRLGRLLQR
jgi:hypothetical protein